MKITFPDKNVREYPDGTSSLDIAKSISEGLARNVLAAKVNGVVQDAVRPINGDANLELLTWENNDGKSTMWHSSAHLMAEALESFYPGIKFWVGPPVEHGFYYDVDLGEQILSLAVVDGLFQHRRQGPTRSAPGGPKIDDHRRFLRFLHDLLDELFRGDVENVR